MPALAMTITAANDPFDNLLGMIFAPPPGPPPTPDDAAAAAAQATAGV